MRDLSRTPITTRLAAHSVGLLSIPDAPLSAAIPVPYRLHNGDVLCLVPRWLDMAATLDRVLETPVMLAVAETRSDGDHWIYCHGVATLATDATWHGFRPVGTVPSDMQERFVLVSITPQPHLVMAWDDELLGVAA